ncbi:MAG TPA: MASE3 domain-containing protein [Kineosporiaceae bacterium]|nr:MASE3 domain-containing protein [Kineosporiaceae bacterium]
MPSGPAAGTERDPARTPARAPSPELIVVALLTAGIAAARFHDYLLFHAFAETFSVVIALTVFSIAWNTRRTLDSPFLLLIGLASGPTALIDMVHTLAFKGMGVFPGTGADLATQLWVAGRIVEVSGIAVAVMVGHRRPHPRVVLAAFSALAAALLLSIFAVKVFPACFVAGTGLTPFKKGSEYVFVTVLLLAFVSLRRRRPVIAPALYPYLTGAVVLLAVQESCFAFYSDVYGLLNLAGHLVKIMVAYLIYSGVVRFGFTEPQDSLFHSLSDLNRRLIAGAEELRTSRERLQGITDHLSEGVFVIVEDGLVRFANPAAVRLLTGEGPELTTDGNCRIDDYLRLRGPLDDHPLRASPFWATVTTQGTAEADDLLLVLPSGRTAEVSCSASVMAGGHAPAQVILSFRDMGALNQARRQAAQAAHLAAIGRLAAGVAHEINTPAQYVGDNLMFIAEGLSLLTSAVGGVVADPGLSGRARETLGSPELAETLAELPQAVTQSRDGLRQIIRIVKSMREFSHPGTAEVAATDINHAIETAVTVTRNEWKHVATVDLHLDPALPPVLGRAAELNQVFVNLIVNAAQAIEASGKPLPGVISVTTALRDDTVEIRVRDSGTGIPESLGDKIFELFFTTKPAGQGTGQGLALCRDVVTVKHGGTIEVDSVESGGATFTVRLPLLHRPGEWAAAPADTAPPPVPVPRPADTAPPPAPRPADAATSRLPVPHPPAG